MAFPLPSLFDVKDTEAARLAALHALDLVEDGPGRELDAIVTLAVALLDTPFAAVTLVDHDRVWAKASHGLDARDECRTLSFCDWTIRSDEILVIPDADHDPRMAARAAAYGGHDIRFYAGAPLHAPGGQRIGALCVSDRTPRTLDDIGVARLRDLAMLVDALIATRATAREAVRVAGESARRAADLQRQERVMHQAERLAMIGSWRLTLDDRTMHWSENVFRIYGLPTDERPTLDGAHESYPPRARAAVTTALARLIETGESMDVEVDFVTAQGLARRVRLIGELELVAGRPVAAVGVLQDVTDRWKMEQALRLSADRDELTGIANRAAFNRALKAAIAKAARSRQPMMLALIDLDRFKAVNDTFGHLIGDEVLKTVGRRLKQDWLAGSFAARLGGDEFALIVHDAALTADPARFARRLEMELSIPVASIMVPSVPSAGTVGTATLDPERDTQRDLFHRADTMLYAAKRRRAGERRIGQRRIR